MNHWYRKDKLFENQIVNLGDTSKIIRYASYNYCNISLLSNVDSVFEIETKFDPDEDWHYFDKIELVANNFLNYSFKVFGKFIRLKKVSGDSNEIDVSLELKN